MILDYDYSYKRREMSISYVDERGYKKLIKRNVDRFKTYRYDDCGDLDTWNGRKCVTAWTNKPSKFDIKTWIRELNKRDQDLIMGRVFPRVYTFDIETMIAPDNSFPEPSEAKMPISTISLVSPEMNTIVLGTRELSEEEQQSISTRFDEYLDHTEFFHELDIKEKPKFKYIRFETEEMMLRYFICNIVSKVPILSGWNCIFFDWYYITTRIKKFYPDLSISLCSCNRSISMKKYTDVRGNDIMLPIPTHTLILDMMNVIKDEDYVVLPIKESYSLDYIAHESMGINKIEYDGTLQDLYDKDYPTYVYYNAIDSILVQLINHRFRTLDHIYMYSIYCMEKIDRCFSKIATTEALIFQNFYDRGLKIVYEERDNIVRGKLQGAYVKKPIAGIHSYVCCNDFASLYPSTIRTCNLSFENYVGAFWKEDELDKYRYDAHFIVVGPMVYMNEGSAKQPSMGKLLHTFIDYDALKAYQDNTKYFVSVNGCVYKNDKDYTFRQIQTKLKANRDDSKYLSKRLDATVMRALQHKVENKRVDYEEYSSDIIDVCKKIGLDVRNSDDIFKLDDVRVFIIRLRFEITYYSCHEQAMKLLMNSMYGGSSHVAFYWFNNNLANDITGESRNLIHKMEHHIPEFWRNNWLKMKDLHKELGIEIDEEQAHKALIESPLITEQMDPDAYHDHSYVYVAYGDTDSVAGDTIIHTPSGDKTIKQLFNDNDYGVVATHNGHELVGCIDKVLNWTPEKRLYYGAARYVMRHKVRKAKWKLTTASGKVVVVTNDHSMVVFRNDKRVVVKPYEILEGDNVLVVNELHTVMYSPISELRERFDHVTSCEQIGEFENEYVYDIEMVDDSHTFIADDVLVHNSLYLCYNQLLKTIKGVENMSIERKRDILAYINTQFMDEHNRQYIEDYYKTRGGKSTHNFELETIALSGVWLNVKKRYGQILLWKDGLKYDTDQLPLKIKGLEVVKSSFPSMSRKILKHLITFLLQHADDKYLNQLMNIEVQKYKQLFFDAPIDEVSGSVKINNYNKYVWSTDKEHIVWRPTNSIPWNVRALANYNHLREYYKLPGEPIYGGKCSWYITTNSKRNNTDYFAFTSRAWPTWAKKYADINRVAMFDQTVLDPINRIMTTIGLNRLNVDGCMQIELF